MHEDNGFTAEEDWKVCFNLEESCRDNFKNNVGRLSFTDENIGKDFLI
jgi:hypothetical protein